MFNSLFRKNKKQKTKKSKIIIANWKMNPQSLLEAKLLVKTIAMTKSRHKKIILPPFIWLRELIKITRKKIIFGAQNCFWEEKGPYTGEISATMIKNSGCHYVLLGHSERKKYFNEDYDIVNMKMKVALKSGLKIILCIGEKEKNSEISHQEIKEQIEKAFNKITKENVKKIIIAYEPSWAISSGNPNDPENTPDTPQNAATNAIFIKKLLVKKYGNSILNDIKVLYGGSLNSKNAEEFLKEETIDGLLIGGASLIPEEITKILSYY